MSEGLVIDKIEFGINNKLIFLFSKNSVLEKYYIYPSKIYFLDNNQNIDYLNIIRYDIQEKSKRFNFEILSDFSELKKDLEKLIIGAIFCDFLKNSLLEGSITNIKYEEILYFFYYLSQEEKLKSNNLVSCLIVFIYYLLFNSGSFDASQIKNKKEELKLLFSLSEKPEEMLKIISKLSKMESNKLNNMLFFLINSFKFVYHRKNIKSLEFIKYLDKKDL